MRKLEKSKEWLERAKQTIPGLTQTMSKSPSQFVQGVSPIYLERGSGPYVYDVDGNEYTDYVCALGPIILGYNHKEIDDAIKKQLESGIVFSLMHPLEVELAEELKRIISCADMSRFGKNGCDVTSAAIRVARAYTGRDKIIHCGYHGCHDWHAVRLPINKGIPKFNQELLKSFKYNDIESLKKVFEENPNQIAAVIMEPVMFEEPRNNFLEKVKQIAHENGALLIFDEMITGFRLSLGGAQQYYNVIPDLATFGKAIANGMPLSILCGRKEIMQECENIFFSMTFGGETLSLAAALKTIQVIKQENVISDIFEKSKRLQEGIKKCVEELQIPVKCQGLPIHFKLSFKNNNGKEDILAKSLFQQETILRGVLTNCSFFVSNAHSMQDIDSTLTAIRESLAVVKKGYEEGFEQLLNGKPLVELFKRA